MLEDRHETSKFSVRYIVLSIIHVDNINKLDNAANSLTKSLAVSTIKLSNENESPFY